MEIIFKEVWLIENIISAEYCANNYFLPHWETPYEEAHSGSVWSDTIESGGAKHGEATSGKKLSGVCASLVKKGYAGKLEDGKDSTIHITKAGWEAYQEWARKNLKEA